MGIHDPEYVKRYGESEAVYKVLQAKATWAVLSFRVLKPDDPGLQAAEQAAGAKLEGDRRYGFHIYRWGQELPDPNDIHTTLVEVHRAGAGLCVWRHGDDPARRRIMVNRPIDTDVAIIGGGPAGSATAIACARRGLRVVLCERSPSGRDRPGETLHPGIAPPARGTGVASALARSHWCTSRRNMDRMGWPPPL